ncbi:hypothetical protein J6590_004784 [Homalodisca vitripennis]|nr:hypothetical protein J6590_004784 [Homalodisca vitripennis]
MPCVEAGQCSLVGLTFTYTPHRTAHTYTWQHGELSYQLCFLYGTVIIITCVGEFYTQHWCRAVNAYVMSSAPHITRNGLIKRDAQSVFLSDEINKNCIFTEKVL